MGGEGLPKGPGKGKGRVGGKHDAAGVLLDTGLERVKAFLGQHLEHTAHIGPCCLGVGIIMLLAETVGALADQGQVQVAGKVRQLADTGAASLDILEQRLGQREDRIGHRIDGNTGRLGPQEVLRSSECERCLLCVRHEFSTKPPLRPLSKWAPVRRGLHFSKALNAIPRKIVLMEWHMKTICRISNVPLQGQV